MLPFTLLVWHAGTTLTWNANTTVLAPTPSQLATVVVPAADRKSSLLDSTLATRPVLTDSLALQWYTAFVGVSDTIVSHPELRQKYGKDLAPFLDAFYCEPWYKQNKRWFDTSGRADTTLELQHALLPGRSFDGVAHVIAQTPSLSGAVKAANMTPEQFAAATLEVEHVRCITWYSGVDYSVVAYTNDNPPKRLESYYSFKTDGILQKNLRWLEPKLQATTTKSHDEIIHKIDVALSAAYRFAFIKNKRLEDYEWWGK